MKSSGIKPLLHDVKHDVKHYIGKTGSNSIVTDKQLAFSVQQQDLTMSICHPSQRHRWQMDKEAIGLSRVQQCSSTYNPPS